MGVGSCLLVGAFCYADVRRYYQAVHAFMLLIHDDLADFGLICAPGNDVINRRVDCGVNNSIVRRRCFAGLRKSSKRAEMSKDVNKSVTVTSEQVDPVQEFIDWIEKEISNGLVDIKFAIAHGDDVSTREVLVDFVRGTKKSSVIHETRSQNLS